MGLARVLDEVGDDPHTSLTQEGTVMGTVDYMPPEQARNTRSADARSDIYSLGGTLYYLLAGKPPFAGGSMIEKLQRLANEAPPALSEFRIDCPRELDEIVQKMLAKQPEDRFQTAGDVVRALKPLAAERIAGRAAVTAAVQSAADTQHAAAAVPTEAEMLFSLMEESVLSAVRQRQAPAATLNRKQQRKLAAIVGTLVAVIAIIAWSLRGTSNSVLSKLPATDRQTELVAKPGPPMPENIRRLLPGHYGDILRLAWSPDGKYLATGGVNGEVRIREPNAPHSPHVVYDKHHAGIINLVWSRDNTLIVSGDFYGKIHIWQAKSGKTVGITARKVQPPFLPAPPCAQAVAISPNNQEIAFEENGNIVRYNVKEKRRIWAWGGGGPGICYSPSGKLLASSAGPFVWDTATGNTVYGKPTGPTPAAGAKWIIPGFLPDDSLALADDKTIRILNCREDKLLAVLPVPEPAFIAQSVPVVPMVAFSVGGDRCRLLTLTELIDIQLPEGTTTRHPLAEPIIHQETAEGNKHTEFGAWDPSFPRNEFAWTWIYGDATITDLDARKSRQCGPERPE